MVDGLHSFPLNVCFACSAAKCSMQNAVKRSARIYMCVSCKKISTKLVKT
ncbi:hypothetical protein HMPREF3190_00440 [Umbribacter vaginalis]|nr:hypothetical protein HMPREF3190_00440 [Coriobacteriales bacterium DNF00809]